MARLSGAQRRKLKRSPSLFTRQQVEQHVAGELDAHRVALANQRARVRDAKIAAPKAIKSAADTQAAERRAVVLQHLNETP